MSVPQIFETSFNKGSASYSTVYPRDLDPYCFYQFNCCSFARFCYGYDLRPPELPARSMSLISSEVFGILSSTLPLIARAPFRALAKSVLFFELFANSSRTHPVRVQRVFPRRFFTASVHSIGVVPSFFLLSTGVASWFSGLVARRFFCVGVLSVGVQTLTLIFRARFQSRSVRFSWSFFCWAFQLWIVLKPFQSRQPLTFRLSWLFFAFPWQPAFF